MKSEIVVKEFCFEMEDILLEKLPFYKNSWKTAGIGELRTKMNKQIKDISDIMMVGPDWDREKVKRKLLHIANYCFFLYSKIDGEKNRLEGENGNGKDN